MTTSGKALDDKERTLKRGATYASEVINGHEVNVIRGVNALGRDVSIKYYVETKILEASIDYYGVVNYDDEWESDKAMSTKQMLLYSGFSEERQ